MNAQTLRLQAAVNELATQNLLLRDRCVSFAADVASANARIAELEKEIKESAKTPQS